jgi:transposase
MAWWIRCRAALPRVLAVEAGATLTEVAARFGVSRQSVHARRSRYRAWGLAGLADRSHRPESCPHETAAQVEAVLCELRRDRPRWGARRLVHELARTGVLSPVPTRITAHRILASA